MKLREMTLPDFTHELASKSPAPGGGSVAALGGALAAGLVSMVGELTYGREKYAAVQDDMKALCDQGKKLADDLLLLIDKDTDSFAAFMDAMKLPKDTDEQKAARRESMQKAAKVTVEVPLETLKLCAEIAELVITAIKEGNVNASTDAASAGEFAHAAALSASYNVRTNLPGIKDAAFVEEKRAAAAALADRAEKAYKELRDCIEARLG
ncbi:MAG: cyclodeaminase/cyclohydrolase family protein [Pyramidobacter sp.]|jgi:formiminotetrahydrofolate cyclodeaminase